MAIGTTGNAFKVASADDLAAVTGASIDADSPAEGLKAEARRTYGIDRGTKRFAPASLTAEIAPIHRARQQYTLE